MIEKTFAIGLYSYTPSTPGPEGFKAFYDLVVSIFNRIGVTPTYFAAEGLGYKGDLTKFEGRAHAKALKSGFANIHVMSLVSNPEGSAEPGYDSYASASLSYVEEVGETLLCLAIEERFLEFGCDAFESILMSCIMLQGWDFGFALSQPSERKPEFHVLGLDDGKLSADEQKRLNKWYVSLPNERLQKIRDVYQFNVVSDAQLDARISSSQTLRDLIREDACSSLCHIEDSNLWLWKVQLNGLVELRYKLENAGLLIA